MVKLHGRRYLKGKEKKYTLESIQEAVNKAGIPYITFWKRLNNGWSVEKALKTPVRPYNRAAA